MSPTSGITKLSRGNFEVWIMLIEAVLTRKGLEGVAFGRVLRPETGPNSKGVKEWDRKNSEARAEIILSVEEEQLAHCFSPNATQIIEELTRVHRAHGLATRLALRRRFLTMKKTSEQSMSDWIAVVRTLALRLRRLGVSVDDEDIILALTMGLPRAYDMFVITLDSTPGDELDLHAIISRLLNEESRHATAAEDDETAAVAAAATELKSAASRLERITCYNCGNKGHFQANCPHPRTEIPSPAVAKAQPAAKAVTSAPAANIVEIYEENW